MHRNFQIGSIVVFAFLVAGVPVAQICLDLADDQEPQFFELWTEWSPDNTPSANAATLSSMARHLRRFEIDLEEHSYFEEIIRPGFQALFYALLRQPGNKALVAEEDWIFYLPGLRYLVEPYYATHESLKPTGADPLTVIADFQKQLAERKIRLLVVVVPGKASIYPERLTSFADLPKQAYRNTRRFVKELHAMGVDVLSLHETLLKKKNGSAQALFMQTDTHWSGLGVRIAAQTVADRIKQQAWYRQFQTIQHQGSRYVRKSLEVTRSGDIPRMTQMAFQSLLFESEQVTCFQVRDHANALYQDDPNSPILLIGDSFSRVFQTDEPTSAGLIANLAYELSLPLASIVNDGGASTLVRQQLARKIEILEGKKLVIWEFVERDIRFGMSGWQPLRLFEDKDNQSI